MPEKCASRVSRKLLHHILLDRLQGRANSLHRFRFCFSGTKSETLLIRSIALILDRLCNSAPSLRGIILKAFPMLIFKDPFSFIENRLTFFVSYVFWDSFTSLCASVFQKRIVTAVKSVRQSWKRLFKHCVLAVKRDQLLREHPY